MRWLPGERIVIDAGLELRRQVVSDELFLLALTRLDPAPPARQLLEAQGVTAEVVLGHIRTSGDGEPSPKTGFTYSPAHYAMRARAEAFAATLGDGAVTAGGDVRLHLGVDPDFRPAGKAHPALLVRGLAALADRLRDAGVPVTEDDESVYVADPFGNRVELLERGDTLPGPP